MFAILLGLGEGRKEKVWADSRDCLIDKEPKKATIHAEFIPSVGAEATMQAIKIVVWEEEGAWLGYLQDYPDYWTQGNTLDDLKEHLKDLYRDVASGSISGIRRVEELIVS